MGGVGPLNGPPLDVHAKMAGVYFHSVTRYTHLLYVSQQHLLHPYSHTHTREHINPTWMIRRIRYIEHTDQHTRPHTRSLTHFYTVNTGPSAGLSTRHSFRSRFTRIKARLMLIHGSIQQAHTLRRTGDAPMCMWRRPIQQRRIALVMCALAMHVRVCMGMCL
jgi:hypothetical protein